jgi:menaquinone-specific isochorismate synthase
MTSTLRTLTVPLDVESSSGGLPSFLVRDDVLCWSRREAGLVGYGELTRFNATGPERFLEADIWWRHLILEAEITDHVEVPGTGPVAFGSFAFSKTSPHVSRLILPELVVGIRDGRAWATQLTFDDGPLTEAGVLASVDRWLTEPEPNGDGSAAGGSDVGLSPEAVAADGSAGHLSRGSLSEAAWMQAVSNGVEEIRAGKLEKLVLARDVVANLPEGVNAAEVLRQLAARYRECWTYGVDGLVGATPEMLIQVEGRTAQARVLAGTLDRRDADGMDGSPMEYAERVLAGSEKQRHEHEIAIDSLTRQLAPFSEAMNSHSEPFILELPNVWHLASDVKAELADIEGHVPTCLALINALHPTAAVCGTPTLIAGALIEDANTVRLYAGCGIVEGSQPEAELAETWAKFRPMLEALGIKR